MQTVGMRDFIPGRDPWPHGPKGVQPFTYQPVEEIIALLLRQFIAKGQFPG